MSVIENRSPGTLHTKWLAWWMRIVGTFYLFLFVAAAILKLPIMALAPEDTLSKAGAGDPLAGFLLDTWVILGLALAALGMGLILNSRQAGSSIALVWTVIGFELIWGIFSDAYQLVRGHPVEKIIPWIVIHLVFITTGILALRKNRDEARIRA
jgi:hypothetical protein